MHIKRLTQSSGDTLFTVEKSFSVLLRSFLWMMAVYSVLFLYKQMLKQILFEYFTPCKLNFRNSIKLY